MIPETIGQETIGVSAGRTYCIGDMYFVKNVQPHMTNVTKQ